MSYAERAHYHRLHNPNPEPCHHAGVWQERKWVAERNQRAYDARPRGI